MMRQANGLILGLGLVFAFVTPPPMHAQDVARGTARDSAGIRIVEHASIPAGISTWGVASVPTRRIGTVDADGPYLFTDINSLDSSSGAGVVVSDRMLREVRAFSEAGMHLWTAGRPGQGPGEFNRLERVIVLLGDSVLAIGDGGRLAVFDRDGKYVKNLATPAPKEGLGQPEINGALRDGTLVASMRVLETVHRDGYIRANFVLGYFGPTGEMWQEVGTFPGEEVAIQRITAPGIPGAGYAMRTLQVGRKTVVAVGRQRIAVGDQARFEIRIWDSEGRLETIVRVLEPPALFDRDAYDRFHRDRQCPAMGCWWDAALPATLPAFGKILMDEQGRIWVEEFVPEYETRRPSWWVLSSTGAFLARVSVSPEFEMLKISQGQAWGLWRDQMDVTYIERRAIGLPER